MNIVKCIRPSTVKEVLDILELEKSNIQLIAGGTDLVIDIRNHHNRGSILVNIANLKELRFIDIKVNEVLIGAATTFTDIVNCEEIRKYYNGLWKACKSVGSPQIRNAGTIGGNICNGSPAADSVPPLLALEAEAVIKSSENNRRIPLKDFYRDKGKVDLRDNEMLYAVSFPTMKGNQGLSFEKIGLRKALAISRISCAVFVALENPQKIKEIRVGMGALGRYPQREIPLEDQLRTKEITQDTINDAATFICEEVTARLKGRSSMAFKSEAIKGLFIRALEGAVGEAKKYDPN
ncbi:MAG: FAD binding domain-containing protein [Bacillota bacterium]